MKKDVSKVLQSDDKTVKNGKKTPKKIDKTFAFFVSIPVVLIVLIVLFLTIPNPIRAATQLKNVERFMDEENISTVVINSASETTGLLNDKEAILKDGEEDELLRRLSYVLDNVKYSSTKTVGYGIWKIKIVMYNSIEAVELYIDNEGIYIENKGRLISYDFGEGSGHEDLLKEIDKYLNE